MTRREAAAAELDAAGARGVVCDVFDPEALRAAVAAASPQVVVHELTSLPAELDLRKSGIYDANNRIRREGTRNLLDAARSPGVRSPRVRRKRCSTTMACCSMFSPPQSQSMPTG